MTAVEDEFKTSKKACVRVSVDIYSEFAEEMERKLKLFPKIWQKKLEQNYRTPKELINTLATGLQPRQNMGFRRFLPKTDVPEHPASYRFSL